MLDIVRYCSVIANFGEVVQIYIDVNIIFNPVCILWNHAFHCVYVRNNVLYLSTRYCADICIHTYTHLFFVVYARKHSCLLLIYTIC